MLHTLTIEVPDTFAEAWGKLQPEQQSSVIDYTARLAAGEERRLEEEADAEWDRLFSDPVKMANFRRWADRALSEGPSTPLDFDRL